jgi:hypothetical protein
MGPSTVRTFLAARCFGTGCEGEVNDLNPVTGQLTCFQATRINLVGKAPKPGFPVVTGQKFYISRGAGAAQAFRQETSGFQPRSLFALSTEIAVAFPGIGDLISAEG